MFPSSPSSVFFLLFSGPFSSEDRDFHFAFLSLHLDGLACVFLLFQESRVVLLLSSESARQDCPMKDRKEENSLRKDDLLPQAGECRGAFCVERKKKKKTRTSRERPRAELQEDAVVSSGTSLSRRTLLSFCFFDHSTSSSEQILLSNETGDGGCRREEMSVFSSSFSSKTRQGNGRERLRTKEEQDFYSSRRCV